MATPDPRNALDHVVLVLFENRSLDNLLGHLYGPEDGKAFEGVIGKNLSNPIPEWAEHGDERETVPYTGRPTWMPRTRTPARSTTTPTPSSITPSTSATATRSARR
ncbi:MAG: hypothetical protein ACRDLL_14820 [Solirubrobacterales bacterium]